MRLRFGLTRDLVLKVDGERVVTNFITLVDHTTALFQTWVAQKPFIERNGNADSCLGTQLVRLSQILNVIVESVHEAYYAMDSVFFGPEERQIREVVFNGDTRITVAELLAWVEYFAGVEAPQLIEDWARMAWTWWGSRSNGCAIWSGSAVTQSDTFRTCPMPIDAFADGESPRHSSRSATHLEEARSRVRSNPDRASS